MAQASEGAGDLGHNLLVIFRVLVFAVEIGQYRDFHAVGPLRFRPFTGLAPCPSSPCSLVTRRSSSARRESAEPGMLSLPVACTRLSTATAPSVRRHNTADTSARRSSGGPRLRHWSALLEGAQPYTRLPRPASCPGYGGLRRGRCAPHAIADSPAERAWLRLPSSTPSQSSAARSRAPTLPPLPGSRCDAAP